MARRTSVSEDHALAVFALQLEGIKVRFADVDRQEAHALYGAAAPQPLSVASLGDWRILLDAVKARLRLTVGPTRQPAVNSTAAEVRASVLECVDALDQLDMALCHALSQPSVNHWQDTDCGEAMADIRAAAQSPGSGVPVSTSPLPNCERAALAIN
jgi:hypothetical protein